jgi:hypothetical protein
VTAAALKFPVLGFGLDVGRAAIRGRERLVWFVDMDDFSTSTSWELKVGARQDMLLVDSAGRNWRIIRIEDLGQVGPFWERAFRFLLQQGVHRISQELVEEGALSFPDLKERICASITANPDHWRDDEAIAGEDGPPQDELARLDELRTAVRSAQTLPQVINALYDEHLPD